MKSLAGVLRSGAHIYQWLANVLEYFVAEGTDGLVVTFDNWIVDNRWSWDGLGDLSAFGYPLGTTTIKNSNVLVAKQLDHPKRVGCPPVRAVSIKHDRVLAVNALGLHKLGELRAGEVITLVLVV